MRISENDILRHVSAHTTEAGRVYQRQGRVVVLDQHAGEIVAQVRGSLPAPYCVRIGIASDDGRALRIRSACSCPGGAYCKHIVAALIECRMRQPEIAAEPRPGKLAQGDEPLPSHISHWLALVERSQTADFETFSPDAQSRLIHVFSVLEYRHAPSLLHVEAWSARVLMNGGFSNSASLPELSNLLSETAPRYVRPTDVKIVRRLSVARGTAYGGPIRLKDDSWDIVEAAIATRAPIASKDRLLRWDWIARPRSSGSSATTRICAP